MTRSRTLQWLTLAALYYGFARIGMLLTVSPGSTTVFWPSAGLALAAVLFYGYRVAPAIFLGALASNLEILSTLNQLPLRALWLPAAGLAGGAMLQAVAGSWLIRRCSIGPWNLLDFRQPLYLVLIGGPLASLIGASIGTGVLFSTGMELEFRAHGWIGWWLADSLGVFVMGPVALMWICYIRDRELLNRNVLATAVLLGLVFAVFATGLLPGNAQALLIDSAGLSSILAAGLALAGAFVFMVVIASGFRVAGERLNTQKALELQNERRFLDALIEGMPLVMYVKDAETREYLRFNTAAYQLFDAPLQDYIGKTREQMLGERIKSDDENSDDTVVNNGEAVDETSEFHLKGKSYWFRSRKLPIKGEDGNVKYILGLAENITEDVEIRKGLMASRRHLALILDNVGEGIFGIDTLGRCTFINPAACRMLQYREEELLEQPIHDIIHHKYENDTPYPVDCCPILGAIRDLQVHEISHEVFWKKNGTSLPVEYVCTPIIDDSQVIGAVVVFSDISRRRTLEQLQVEHTKRLEQINQELEEFSYIASHDIQEPLRTLNCFCEFLVDDLGPDLPEQAKTDIHYIIDASQRMQTLITEMLDYSRAGRATLDTTEVSLNHCVDNVKKDLMVLIRETDATITAEKLPPVIGDESKLTRVFQNLIHNAIKFRGESKPWVRIGVEPGATEAGNEEFVLITVRDNGIGIDRQFHQQIFGAFKRLHSSERYPGSGIGLAMVKRIIDRHGGEISVESEPGRGTTFYIRLRRAIVQKVI